jgi:hypothetical protein
LAEEASDAEALVRLEIHDASRLEWSVSIPLPEGRPLNYTIDVDFEIPANAFARHTPWDQLQSFTRLDGPKETTFSSDPVSIDTLRRGAVALANKLARASEGFARHCLYSASLFASTPRSDLEESLTIWIDVAAQMAVEARTRLCRPLPDEAAELVRERALVDEYVSVRLLEMLAGAERALRGMLESRCPHVEQLRAAVAAAEGRVADTLERELHYRNERGFVCAEPKAPHALERYLDRASRLKKHFQEVLFLESETYQVADRIHHWVAAFVALLASTWAFAWQIALMSRQPSTESQVGSGIVMLAVIAGLVYATKDRMKELGRTWISGNVHRLYAQRVARYRAPVRRLPGRDVIVAARESCDQSELARPDPLNPESGATVPSTLIRYVHKGTVSPQAELTRAGVRRIKHVFRYDLSPLFARLDDAVKQVPVLDTATRRVTFTDAPRCYRVPVRVRVQCKGVGSEENATLVLHKRGLDRLERAELTGLDLL